jgi:hypothetical protein
MSQSTNPQFTSEGQLSIQLQLSGLQSQMQDRSTDATTQIQHLRNCIQEKVELAREASYRDTDGHGCDGTVGTPEQNFSKTLRLVQKVKASLNILLQNRNGSPPEIRILKEYSFHPFTCVKRGCALPTSILLSGFLESRLRNPPRVLRRSPASYSKRLLGGEQSMLGRKLQWLLSYCNGSGIATACSTSLGRQDPGNRQ